MIRIAHVHGLQEMLLHNFVSFDYIIVRFMLGCKTDIYVRVHAFVH